MDYIIFHFLLFHKSRNFVNEISFWLISKYSSNKINPSAIRMSKKKKKKKTRRIYWARGTIYLFIPTFGQANVSITVARNTSESCNRDFCFFQVSYLNFERQPSSIAAVGIANGMMVSCNKLRSGFENVGSVTGTFYPPVASPHDQTLQHYTSTQSSKTANYSMQSTVESNYNPVQCANRQQSMGIRGAAEGCSGNSSFILTLFRGFVTLGSSPVVDHAQLERTVTVLILFREILLHNKIYF